VKLATQATELMPSEWSGWRTLGRAYRRAGDPKAAKEAWNKSIEVGHADPVAHSDIAQLLSNDPDLRVRDTARALALAKRAVDLAPKSGESWTALGAAQFRVGDAKAALTALEKAAELQDGGTGIDFFFMAMAHWQSGNKDKARKFYEQGVLWIERYAPLDDDLRRFRSEAAALMGLGEPATGY
jgi:Flp pilus assembly protein TadD